MSRKSRRRIIKSDGAIDALCRYAPMLSASLGSIFEPLALPFLERAFELPNAESISRRDRRNRIRLRAKNLSSIAVDGLSREEIRYKNQMSEFNVWSVDDIVMQTDKLTVREQKFNRQTRHKFYVSATILSILFIVVIGAMIGEYELIKGGPSLQSSAIAELITGVGSTLIGYVAALAQQVTGHYFSSYREEYDV